MCKLLRAHFYRLRRSRALWLCMAAAFALSLRYSSCGSAPIMRV